PVKPAAEPPPPPPPAPPPPDAGLLANFTFTASEVEVGDEMTFFDASSGSVGAWTWDFGDGGSATGPVVTHKWAKAGSFTVTLTVSNSNTSDRNSTSITVTPAETPRRPTANFVFSPGSAEVDEEVTFTDTSTGRPTTLTWDFGDGATATGPKVTHRWKRAGPMRVTLVAANDVGADRATTSVVIVDKVVAPKASFTVSASPLMVGQAVTFVDTSSGQPTNPVWDFGDGSPPAAGPRVTHAFATAQPYTVRLTVRNAKGEDSTERVLSVQAPAERPVARFTVSAPTAEVGQRVEFESVSLNNPTELQWSFGDGASAVGPRAAHVWNAPGPFTVTLVARNQAGASTAQTTLRIAPATPPTAPKADFDRNPADVAPLGAPVSFIDRSTGVITSWTWTFGAPTSVSTERNPVRTFSTPGAHQVTLQVRGPGGVDSVTKTVRVADGSVRPVAAFSFSPPAPVVGDRVLFRDESQNSPVTFSWNFGDNSPLDTTRNPTHVFRSPGIYRVTLTVANASGESTRTNDVTVTASQRQAPTAEFQFSPGSPSAGDLVTFTDVTDGAVTTPIWTFPGGRVVASPASQRSVQHTFNDVGDQQVSMKVCWVEEPTNCNERTKTVSVRAPSQKPTASFEMSGAVLDQRTVLLGKPVSFTDTSTGAAITSRRWLIDGAPTSTAQKVDHPGFTQPGDVEVELTVANATGADTVRRTIRVINAVKPTAQFSFAPSTPAVDDPVAFNGRLSESPTSFVTAWRWDFGDGAAATIAQPTHRFAAPGLYPVRLTVTNQWGADTVTHVVTVVPTFAVRVTNGAGSVVTSPFSGVVGEAFGFEVTGAAATAVVSWTFGDGVTVAGLTARHTWSAAGAFDVRVTVTVNGAAATQTLRAVISPPPAPPASDSSAGGGPGAAAELPAG
ncbi:MAG: PKD domain-containing protein, partial [Acidimicrobiales bacterium]